MKQFDAKFEEVFHKLLEFGLLLESDPKLPSVCTLITGEPMKGSWWSHPLAQTIFQVNERLDDHRDVLIAKLLSGKVTFVHRQFWPMLLAIGTSEEPWQMRALPEPARKLLKLINKKGPVRSDQVDLGMLNRKELSEAVRLLERRLLVHSAQVHTESGAHAKVLQTWERFAASTKLKTKTIPIAEAKKRLEQRVREMNERFRGTGTLPWQ